MLLVLQQGWGRTRKTFRAIRKPPPSVTQKLLEDMLNALSSVRLRIVQAGETHLLGKNTANLIVKQR